MENLMNLFTIYTKQIMLSNYYNHRNELLFSKHLSSALY